LSIFFGSRLKVLKMAPYELNSEPSSFEEASDHFPSYYRSY
jgi:hypothetical protein